jgi:hypothetical protein
MKVKELIEELKKCNQDADVVIGEFNKIIDMDLGVPSSCVSPVIIEAEDVN